MPLIDNADAKMVGHVKITDAETGELLLDKMNSINFVNMSESLALVLANRASGHIHEMCFGNGASTVSGIGAINYFPPNTQTSDSQLYNQTYSKVVDDMSPQMDADQRDTNNITVQHGGSNATYADIVVTCTLGHNEPVISQTEIDDASDMEQQYVFDEIGLKGFSSNGNGKLLTHVIFHPILKSQNRIIEIEYTLRIYMV
jgi:hypothetical protein